jgi:hypothetical protein
MAGTRIRAWQKSYAYKSVMLLAKTINEAAVLLQLPTSESY